MQFSSKMSAGIYIQYIKDCIVVLKLWTCWVINLKEGSEKNPVTAQKWFPLYWNSILCCKSHWNTKIDLWACVGKEMVGDIEFYFKSSHHCVCLSVWRGKGSTIPDPPNMIQRSRLLLYTISFLFAFSILLVPFVLQKFWRYLKSWFFCPTSGLPLLILMFSSGC